MNLRKTYFIAIGLATIIIASCNKQKKLMEDLVGNWKIEKSEKLIIYNSGTEDVIESIENAGTLVISEDPNSESKESRMYDFFYIDNNGDTLQQKDTLVTDDKNKRMIMLNALGEVGDQNNITWTIEKSKKRKQVWSSFGVDTTMFYPPNNHNPGAASYWTVWTITLKKE